MQNYHIWFDLRPGTKDIEFSAAVENLLDQRKGRGHRQQWRLERRTLGLCSADLGELYVGMATTDLGQLQSAFDSIAPRSGEEENLHAGVWSKVLDLKFEMYWDCPDKIESRGYSFQFLNASYAGTVRRLRRTSTCKASHWYHSA